MINKLKLNQKGFSLTELLVAMAVTSLIIGAVWVFVIRGYEFSEIEMRQVLDQEEARKSIEEIGREIRETTQSDSGAYPIEEATDTSFTFFSDIDNDGDREKINYRLAGTEIIKEIYEPSGYPITYPSEGTEEVVAQNVQNASVDLFSYFDENFTGSESPLASPIDLTQVRVVRITVVVDSNPGKQPGSYTLSTDVQLRNLKDNL